jgi:hypothetical protein
VGLAALCRSQIARRPGDSERLLSLVCRSPDVRVWFVFGFPKGSPQDIEEEIMKALIPWLWAAGAVQLVIIAANFVLPKKLRCRENLTQVSPMIREVFIVHWVYIILVLGIFTSLSFWFTPELAGATRLGRYLSAVIAVFWLLRVPIQIFFYDDELRKQNRFGDVVFLLAVSYLGIVFSVAALGVLR